MPERDELIRQIRQNIETEGHHLYLIKQSRVPRFAYSIGLREKLGAELILAGGALFMGAEVMKVLNRAANTAGIGAGTSLAVEGLGTFTLRQVDDSWARLMLLGALDYYGIDTTPALQVVPDRAHWTIDVPDLSKPFSGVGEPVWRWIREPWDQPFPPEATAATDLAALRGAQTTEAARWEEDEWEVFAGDGPDVTEAEMRVVPLSTLVGHDPSLAPVAKLAVGKALCREEGEREWQKWGSD